MFTGIIIANGRVLSQLSNENTKLILEVTEFGQSKLEAIELGDSICVNGCCLTVTDKNLEKNTLSFDVSIFTLSCTTLGKLKIGDFVNLETALTPSTPMGGHYVSGHVDALIRCEERTIQGQSLQLYFVAKEWMNYIAPKGSVCINGVSLTVTSTTHDGFWVNLVPHTLSKTTLEVCDVGTMVNLEIDMLARYMVNYVTREKSGTEYN